MKVVARNIGLIQYQSCWEAMRSFTSRRTDSDLDEFWTAEHPSVYTLGKAGNIKHILSNEKIPVVKADRGGEVTYHGVGQLVLYTMVNVRRLGLGPREFVINLEAGVVDYLRSIGILAVGRRDAPGVYVQNRKIGSIGLRFSKGFSYHGLSINIDMDLTPFTFINPCGYAGMKMTQLSEYDVELDLLSVSAAVREKIYRNLYAGASISELPASGFEPY